MTNAPAFTIKGEPAEKFSLPEKLFNTSAAPVLLAQAVRVYLSNQRKARAKTKTRSEVIMTTAKMYRQKGTGRARHGSYSAPVFVGGAIAHGPRGNQNYEMKLTAGMKRLALAGALSEKVKTKNMIILTGKSSTGKTKEAVHVLESAKLSGVSALLVAAKGEDKLFMAWKNLKGVTAVHTNQLNSYIVLKHRQLVMTEAAVKEAEQLYVG